MANDSKTRNLDKMRIGGYFGVSEDDAAGTNCNHVFSTTCRVGIMNFDVDEILSGLRVISNKKSETIANLNLVSF